jgi:hypothetical protein
MIALGAVSVLAKLKFEAAGVAVICLLQALTPRSALAITADVARKCSALTAKAYPPRVVGNPAAGVQNGSSQDFRNYFHKCVANGGNPPEQESQKNTQSPDAGSNKNGQAPQRNK